LFCAISYFFVNKRVNQSTLPTCLTVLAERCFIVFRSGNKADAENEKEGLERKGLEEGTGEREIGKRGLKRI